MGPFLTGIKQLKFLVVGHRLLHEMDRSKNLSHYHRKEYSKFFLEKCHL